MHREIFVDGQTTVCRIFSPSHVAGMTKFNPADSFWRSVVQHHGSFLFFVCVLVSISKVIFSKTGYVTVSCLSVSPQVVLTSSPSSKAVQTLCTMNRSGHNVTAAPNDAITKLKGHSWVRQLWFKNFRNMAFSTALIGPVMRCIGERVECEQQSPKFRERKQHSICTNF